MKTNQERAQAVADKLHALEKAHRKTGRAIAELHKLLEDLACDCAPDLGIDVAPLSAGGDKPR